MPHSVLCIDTSTTYLTVALLNAENLSYKILPQINEGNNLALEHINNFLQENGMLLEDLNSLAYVVGPGSFTGLRIGASIVQAINLACNIPAVGISRLQLLSEQAYQSSGVDRVIVSLNALRDEYYFGEYCFDKASKIMQPLLEDCLYLKGELINELSTREECYSIVSDSTDILNMEIKKITARYSTTELDDNIEALANIVLSNNKNEFSIPSASILPKYLKGPHINR